MGEEYSVAALANRLTGLEVQVAGISTTQTLNHSQNRTDIHDLRGTMQILVDKVTGLQITNARWSVGAGIVTAVALKMIDHFIK